MTCDAATLIEAAKCLRFPQDRTRAIWVYLLCQWASQNLVFGDPDLNLAFGDTAIDEVFGYP